MISENDILEALRSHAGIDAAQTGEAGMRACIRRAMDGCAEPERLADIESPEWKALLESVLVPETWFFRNLEAFEALVRWVAEDWMPRRNGRSLRVLSLPCATGEEAYSLAMALLELGMAPSEFRVQAGDISPVSLAVARRGEYRRNAFRTGFDESRHGRFFESAGDGARRVREEVRDCVEFSQMNLVDDSRVLPSAEVIFCRNALIYFSIDAQVAVLKRFHVHLPDDGLLFLGPVEPPLALQCGFFPAGFPMAFACTKVGPRGSTAPPPMRHAVKTTEKTPPKKPSPTPVVMRRPLTSSCQAEGGSVCEKSLPVAAASVSAGNPIDDLLLRARAMADLGNVAAAADLLATLPISSATHVEVFVLRGVIHEALGDLSQAEADFRKAIYLDPAHEEALSHLALLLDLQGRTSAAATLRRRAKFQSATPS